MTLVHEAPSRHGAQHHPVLDALAGVFAVALVAFVSAVFAHLFREGIFAVGDALFGHKNPVEAARHANPLLVFSGVFVGLVAAAAIGRAAARWRGERLGLAAVAAAARNEGLGPSFRATSIRSSGTFVAASGLASVGRESAILEMGGSFGFVGDKLRRKGGSALATTGMAAAFAAAYHAPLASMMYVEEHLGFRHDRRTAVHTVAGALIGFVTAWWLLGARALLPHSFDPYSWKVIGLALLALLPAYAASRVFGSMRELLGAEGGWIWRWRNLSPLVRSIVFAAITAVLVVTVPLTAGNGLEAIRESLVHVTLGVALALMIGKLAATAAAISTGAPAGIVSPSLAVAAGSAVLVQVIVRALGGTPGDAGWDATLIVMSIGIAISVHAPLMAIFMVPEMAGDLRLIPLSAAAVGIVWLLDRELGRRRSRRVVLRRTGLAARHPARVAAQPDVLDVDA